MNNTLRVSASRTAAALGTVMAAAILELGAAGPAQALTCPAGYVIVVFNGIESCSPTSTGGVPGGGGVVIGGEGSTVPGGAAPIVGGSGGGSIPGYQTPAAPAPNQPVKGFAPAENPVIAGVPAEVPATEAVPTETPAAVTPSETSATPSATASAAPSPSETTSTAPIRSEPASQTDNGTAAGFIVGSLGVLVVAAAAVYWRRLRAVKHSTVE